MAAFDLSDADLDRIDDWFATACIAWGEDEAHREAVGVGRWREHSFAFGLDRLLLGYATGDRSEEHTSELQSLMRISYAVFCLKKKNTHTAIYPATHGRSK